MTNKKVKETGATLTEEEFFEALVESEREFQRNPQNEDLLFGDFYHPEQTKDFKSTGLVLDEEGRRMCPKCHSLSGDDFSQCGGVCPVVMSPHYKPQYH